MVPMMRLHWCSRAAARQRWHLTQHMHRGSMLRCSSTSRNVQASTHHYKFCSDASSSSSLDVHRHNNVFIYRHFSQSVKQSDCRIEHERRGNESYELALEALRNAANAKKALEMQLMREQYEAMERQRQKTNQDRDAGVAVVRTIVNQTRKSNTVKVDKWDNKSVNDDNAQNANNTQSVEEHLNEDYYQKVAFQHLEEAAMRFGHPLALVRLGNECLERANKSLTLTDEPLVNYDRCTEWIDESPIDLSSILTLSLNTTTEDIEGQDDTLSPYISMASILYEEAGKAGSAEAWFNLGHLLWDRSEDDDAVKLKAMDAFNAAVDLGDSDAMYFVAVQYLSSSQEDYETGYQLLCRAGHQYNHGPALHHLTLLSLQDGKSDEFRELLTKAVEAGNPESLFLQGHCYYKGEDGYEVDVKAALDSFLAAAENDHVDSMVSAGAILHQGFNGSHIIRRDQRRAFELYQRAGELGSIEGWRNVVSCYATGEGVKKDLEMAKHIANTMLKVDD